MSEVRDIQERRKHKFSWRIFAENFVFQEGDTYYKMPSFIGKQIFYKYNSSFEEAEKNLELIKKYFGKVFSIAETKILKDEKGHYIIKQKAVNGEKLTKSMLSKNSLLLSKFKKLIIINEIFWEKEGVFLDLLGTDFIAHPNTIHNIIADEKTLYIFDFGLLEKKSSHSTFNIISKLSRFFQLRIIERFFLKGIK